jgi:hypothetical protein
VLSVAEGVGVGVGGIVVGVDVGDTGVTVAVGVDVGVTPVPVSGILRPAPKASEFTISVPVALPAEVGEKDTGNEQLEDGSTIPQSPAPKLNGEGAVPLDILTETPLLFTTETF